MDKLKFLLSYLKYLIKSQTRHDVHSPFVFDLVEKVINNKNELTGHNEIEKFRKELWRDETVLTITDLGAGSVRVPTKKRKVMEIAKTSLKSKKYASLLARLIRYFAPKTVIELGTSLGITTLYFSNASPGSAIYTIEGSPEIVRIARSNFNKVPSKNIESIQGNFDDELPALLQNINHADFVFFDGNHRKEATLKYFKMCLKYKTNESVFVFDDINWSEEMQEAWEEIKAHPEVSVTVDLFFQGIVFFRKELQKQDFIIRF